MPNPFMDRMELLRVTELHLDFVGDAFWLKQRNGLGKPVGYWPIPPHWVIETPTPERPRYRVGYRTWQAEIPQTEIRQFHVSSAVNPYTRGSGIGWALADEIQVDEYAAKLASAFFFNRARADFIFVGGDSVEETKRLELDWNNRVQGVWRAFRPFFATGNPQDDLKKRIYEFQQPTMEQLVYPNLRKVGRDIILQVWGVSPELFGIVENSNRATIEAAEYLFSKWVIVPKLERLRGTLQREVVEEFDERAILHFDSPVAEDHDRELGVMKAAPWAFGESEWRARAGYLKPAPTGDVRVVPLNSYATTDLMDEEQRPSAAAAPAAAPSDAPTPEDNLA